MLNRAAPEIRDFNPSLPLVVDNPDIITIRQQESSESLPETLILQVGYQRFPSL